MNSPTFAHKFAQWVLGNRALILITTLLIVIGAGTGLTKISMSSDYRYYFGEDNPQRVAFDKLQKVYSQDDSAIIAIKPKSGDIFNARTLKMVQEIADRAWKIPYSYRVDSVTNFQNTTATEDDLIVRDLVREGDSLDAEQVSSIKSVALSEPLLVDQIVSKDGLVTGVNIRVSLPGKSPMEVPEIAAAVRKLSAEFEKKYPDHEFRLSGIAMLNNAFNEAGMKDMTTLTPLMYLILIIIMVFFLKSFFATLSTVMVLLFSVIGGMGLAGHFGIPLTPPSSIAPTVILTLAIADSVHILKAILAYMKEGMAKREAILEGLRVNLQPVFLTSLTTVIGFLSLNLGDTPPFHDLGNITALGVTLAFIFSVTTLPVLADLFPMNTKVTPKEATTSMSSLASLVTGKRTAIMIVSVLTTGFLFFQVPKIKLNDQFVQYFTKEIEFRNHTDWMMENFAGIYQVNFDLKAKDSQGITDPEFLATIDAFTKMYRNIPGVTHVNSISDTFKRLNKNMHADDQAYYKLPDSRELAAQYLLLYEMSLPYGLDLNNQIDVDKAATRIVVTLGNLDTNRMLEITKIGEDWLKKNAPEYMHTLGASPAVMFAHISSRNVRSMFWGTMIAFALITLTLMIALKSVKYGLISLLPNIIPAGMAFGIWSLTVGEAGFAISVVGSVTLGIVVDDTVHFLSKYVRARREKGLTADEAINVAFGNVGPALVATSVILVAGFSVLMLSTFKMNWILGALSALTIAVALIVDFTFLPALLSFVDKDKEKNKSNVGGNMKIKNATLTALAMTLLLGLGISSKVQAETMEEKGLAIAKKIDSSDMGWVNQVADVEMVLKNRSGQESKRLMKLKSLEVKGDGDKSLTIFKSPKDVKGTSFLSFSHPLKSDDQWLYLPALRRVKRISSDNKSGPFMGSEFAYEDISSQEVGKYTYKYIKAEKMNGLDGHVIERYPVDKNSGYTKQIVWVDSKEYRLQKIDFYDRKDSLLKTLTYSGYNSYAKNTWRPDLMSMINHQSGKSTKLIWKNYRFGVSINERDFDKNALKRLK
jgi:predicted RND superfamily exporter protein